jgi:GxxExxY protein
MEISKELNDLTYSLVGIGPGFPEEYYQKALEYELRKNNIIFESQKPIQVFYEEIQVGINYLDLVVDEKIIIEIKSVKFLDNVHRFQVLKYLAATDYQIALLINFGQESLKYERIIPTKKLQKFRESKKR